MTTTTSAPGKLFLFGEYGVLAGGWAVIAAVNRRVVAQRRAVPTSYTAAGATLDNPTALPRAVLAEVGLADDPDQINRLTTDIGQLFDHSDDVFGRASPQGRSPSASKLGLGSSAASTVALTAACAIDDAQQIDASGRRDIFQQSFRAHRRLQDGRGSGADVAASALGGFVGYQLTRPSPGFLGWIDPAAPELTPRRRSPNDRPTVVEPACLHSFPAPPVRIEAIWLGAPAESKSFVSKCIASRSQATIDAVRKTAAVGARAVEALADGAAAEVLELVGHADRALERLGEAMGAPVVTDCHRLLRRQAAARGIRVKPSGAGGGDFSLAVGPDDAPWRSFLDGLPGTTRHIPLVLGAEGVRRESGRRSHP